MAKNIPKMIINHIATKINLIDGVSQLNAYDKSGYRKHHLRVIRKYMNVKSFRCGGKKIIDTAMRDAAKTKDDTADIINTGIEDLVKNYFEIK